MNLSEISDFKKRELEYELRHEKDEKNYAVFINDKQWKVFKKRRSADKACDTLRARGKDSYVKPTYSPVSEAGKYGNPEKGIPHAKASASKPKKIKPSSGHESPHPLKGKLVGDSVEYKDAPIDEGFSDDPKADPKIVAKFADVDPKLRSYYITKWADEKGIDSDDAMFMAGYVHDGYIGAGAWNWRYVGLDEDVNEGPVVPGNFPNTRNKNIAKALSADQLEYVSEKLDDALQAVNQMVSQGLGPVELVDLQQELQIGMKAIKSYDTGDDIIEAAQVYVLYKDGSPISKHSSKKDADMTAAMLSVPGASGKIEVRGPMDDPQQAKKEKDKFNYVGHTKEADEPTADKSARHKLDHSLRAQGHKVEKDKKKELKKGVVKHKGKLYDDLMALEDKKKAKKDACYHKVKSRYKVWPSAYASGALVQCRKKGAKNWGNKSKKKK